MSKSYITDGRRRFFKTIFSYLYNMKWKSEGRTQEEFAEEIRKQFPDPEKCSCNGRYVSEWLNGNRFPDAYLEQIANVLNVSPDIFVPSIDSNQGLYYSELESDEETKEIHKYSDKQELEFDFLSFIRKCTAFENLFPKFIPLECEIDKDGSVHYIRKESSNINFKRPSSIYQYTDSNHMTSTLNESDIDFIKDLQTRTEEFVESMYLKRHEEMQIAEKNANKKKKKLSSDQLNQLDRFGHYEEEE